MPKPLILRRKLAPRFITVDVHASGYNVRFERVKIGSVFKWRTTWYIKRAELSAVINGTHESVYFSRQNTVFVQSHEDLVLPVDGGPSRWQA